MISNGPPATTDQAHPRRRVPVSLWILLVLAIGGTGGALWLGVWARERNLAIRAIQGVAVRVGLDDSADPGPLIPFRGARWLARWFGDAFLEVECIDFSAKPIKDADLEALKSLSEVRVLVLDDTQITDAGLEHFQTLPLLQFVGLKRTRITDAGLAALAKLPNLEVLLLDDTQVGDAGIDSLRHLTNISTLSLAGTQVTDAGLTYLKELRNLRVINLARTQVTEAGAADLKSQVPNVEVER